MSRKFICKHGISNKNNIGTGTIQDKFPNVWKCSRKHPGIVPIPTYLFTQKVMSPITLRQETSYFFPVLASSLALTVL